MHNIMIFGAGKIGSILSVMLSHCGGYKVYLADTNFDLFNKYVDNNDGISLITQDIQNADEIKSRIREYNISVLVSALPFYLTLEVAKLACSIGTHYFDLTEDIGVASKLHDLARDQPFAFIPQCGLAPGLVGLIANDLMKGFDEVKDVKLRVGALPQFTNNSLKYSLTWSTDGLINEYLNKCEAIKDSKLSSNNPLDDLEHIIFDGIEYEAFNTSGGLGNLAKLNVGKVNNMDYKSLRYKGHMSEMTKLIDKYVAANDYKELKKHLEDNIPTTNQDVVVIYVSVNGYQNNIFKEKIFAKKIYPTEVGGIEAKAIQIATSVGISGAIHAVLQNGSYKGFVYQETMSFQDLLESKFGKFIK